MPVDRKQLLVDFYDKYDKSKVDNLHLDKVLNLYKDESDEQLLTDLYDKYDKSKVTKEHFDKVITLYNTAPVKKKSRFKSILYKTGAALLKLGIALRRWGKE